MPRKSSKYLEFYKKCMESGRIPYEKEGGLCETFPEDQILELFQPRIPELEKWESYGWWASGLGVKNPKRRNYFTPLRQTIVLLMHEMTVNPIYK